MISYKQFIADQLAAPTGLAAGELVRAVSVAPPGIDADLALPCFPLARALRKAPALIATELAAAFVPGGGIVEARAQNGYLNFRIDPAHLARGTLEGVHRLGAAYGRSEAGAGRTVVIDFSSPNMGKELAFHHLRGTMLGNSLSRIFTAGGYQVLRVNHLGDWGTSYGKLILMYLREDLPVTDKGLAQITIGELGRLYRSFSLAAAQDPALEDAARSTFQKLEAGDPVCIRLWKAFRQITLDELVRLYGKLGVEFDKYLGEAFFVPQTMALMDELGEKKLLTRSQGAMVVDLEAHGLPPLLLEKSDGATLYQTRDLCAAIYRQRTFGFARNLYVVDNGQSLHFRQVFKVLELMGHPWFADCEHVPYGLILTRDAEGHWEKGKTRAGGASLLKDVLERARDKILAIIEAKNPALEGKAEIAERIGLGALVFNDLKNNRQNDVRFDWDTVLSFEGDTGPYVVNAYVRLCSILRKAAARGSRPPEPAGLDYSRLQEPEARRLVAALADYPVRVAAAMEAREPCVLGQYALELAGLSHSFIHACRVLGSPEESERLFLAACVRTVMGNCLGLLGVPVVEEM